MPITFNIDDANGNSCSIVIMPGKTIAFPPPPSTGKGKLYKYTISNSEVDPVNLMITQVDYSFYFTNPKPDNSIPNIIHMPIIVLPPNLPIVIGKFYDNVQLIIET